MFCIISGVEVPNHLLHDRVISNSRHFAPKISQVYCGLEGIDCGGCKQRKQQHRERRVVAKPQQERMLYDAARRKIVHLQAICSYIFHAISPTQ